MMNSPLLFIPLAVWLPLVLVGLTCAVIAVVALRRAKAAQQRRRALQSEPPLLSGTTEHGAASSGCWLLLLRALLAAGFAALAVGVLGVWSTKVSVGFAGASVAEWSDGRAPELEPVIRKHCAPFIARGKSIGLAAAVVTPTNATIMTFGHASLSSDEPTPADTMFEIGSITKTFTGLALARQIEQGLVRLDQPIQELLPPGVELAEAARGISLRQLTSHSSGFPRVADDRSPLPAIRMLLFGGDPYAGYGEVDLLADVRSVKLQSAPGTKACYSNFGMTLLGYLLARKEGTDYEALIKQQVCLPLGMKNTTITLNRAQAPLAAQGYRAVLRCRPLLLALRSDPWFENNDLGGAGALRSTAPDMLKYLQANMHPEGQPLEHALRESHKVLFKEDERTSFGMNWIHVESQRLKQTIICHNGGTGGFRSFIGFTGDKRFGVLILSNTSEDADDLAVDLLRELTGPPAVQDRLSRPRRSAREGVLPRNDRS